MASASSAAASRGFAKKTFHYLTMQCPAFDVAQAEKSKRCRNGITIEVCSPDAEIDKAELKRQMANHLGGFHRMEWADAQAYVEQEPIQEWDEEVVCKALAPVQGTGARHRSRSPVARRDFSVISEVLVQDFSDDDLIKMHVMIKRELRARGL